MKILLKLFIPVIVILFFSCEKDANVTFNSNSIPIVNCFFSSDSLFKVNVTKSLNMFNSLNIEYINNAEVKIYENDQFKELLKFTANGNYISSFKPIKNAEYKVVVNSEFGETTAKNILPQSVEIESIDTSYIIENNTENLDCHIKFKDNPNEENYYILQIKASDYYIVHFGNGIDSSASVSDTVYVEQSIYFDFKNTIIEDNIGRYFSYGAFFSDKLINGNETDLNIKIWNISLSHKSPNTVKFYLKSISKEYYLYAKSYSKMLNFEGDLFGDPIQVFSNVENGGGIFGGYSQDMDSIVYIPRKESFYYGK